MWELKRKSSIVEDVKIGGDVLHINIDPDRVAMEYRAAYADVVRARDAIAGIDRADVESLDRATALFGEALCRLMGLLFGNENIERIVSFYDGRFVEMFGEILPFLTQVIIPAMERAIAEMRENWGREYRAATRAGKGGKISGFAKWPRH